VLRGQYAVTIVSFREKSRCSVLREAERATPRTSSECSEITSLASRPVLVPRTSWRSSRSATSPKNQSQKHLSPSSEESSRLPLWSGCWKRKTGTGQMSGFATMTSAANLNHGKYQRIDRSPSTETDECLSCEPYVSNRYLTCPLLPSSARRFAPAVSDRHGLV
jgi:hypothetical protein